MLCLSVKDILLCRAYCLVGTMDTAYPTTRTALTFNQFCDGSFDMVFSCP